MDTTSIELRGVNAYLVEGESLVLVDAGWPWSVSSLEKAVKETGHTLAEVDGVLVKHYDLDHVGGLRRLTRSGLDAPLYVAEPDASFLDRTSKPLLCNRKGAFQRLVGVGIRKPSLPVERVEDGDEVAGFEVCVTPGHTPGHVAHLGDEVAFLGDAVRARKGAFELMPSLMSYDAGEARRTVEKLAERFEGGATYVGHGAPVEGASEKLRELV